MKTYICGCGNTLFFDNSVCFQCGKQTGFYPDKLQMYAIKPLSEHTWQSDQLPGQVLRKCNNFSQHNVCNWLIPNEEKDAFCTACRLNKIIPDLDKAGNLPRWYRLESAKRRTLYSLYKIGLRVPSMKEQPDIGLEFCFMEDVKEYQPITQELVTYDHIMTGHHSGTITINIEEADHVLSEVMRQSMNEPYRTTLGHIRHETGHYFWDRLISSSHNLDSFRQLFGDERHDYQQSLQHYYQTGPKQNWQASYISAYASAHPWEDWAECWAHYLHMTDTMETAQDFAISVEGNEIPEPLSIKNDSVNDKAFDDMLTGWLQLTNAMNALNRSMGLRDAYPFSISEDVAKKLRYLHDVINDYISSH